MPCKRLKEVEDLAGKHHLSPWLRSECQTHFALTMAWCRNLQEYIRSVNISTSPSTLRFYQEYTSEYHGKNNVATLPVASISLVPVRALTFADTLAQSACLLGVRCRRCSTNGAIQFPLLETSLKFGVTLPTKKPTWKTKKKSAQNSLLRVHD